MLVTILVSVPGKREKKVLVGRVPCQGERFRMDRDEAGGLKVVSVTTFPVAKPDDPVAKVELGTWS